MEKETDELDPFIVPEGCTALLARLGKFTEFAVKGGIFAELAGLL